MTPLRITWVLPSLAFTGGIRVVYEHTRQLRALGHEVRLVVPAGPAPSPFSAEGRRALAGVLFERLVVRSDRMLRYYGLESTVQRVPRLEYAALPDGDILLATEYESARWIADAPARAGRGTFFIQHYEAYVPELEPAVDFVWRLPLEKIVIATWLARLARERFGLAVRGPVLNGIDLEQFHARGRVENDPPVVGMLYERIPWKGTEDGLAAVERARRDVPGLRLHLFGRHRLRHRLRPGDRYTRSPSPARLGAIYRGCDFFLSPSWTEGYGLPPMEAMGSGCAVVSTEVGGVPDFATPGRTILTAPPRAVDELAVHLVHLARNRPFARAMAEAGRAQVAQLTWPRVSAELERELLDIAGRAVPR